MLEVGLVYTSTLVVDERNTALAMGSGDMEVLATPVMMALMEHAAMLAVAKQLPEGSTTVGGYIESSHLHPSKVGSVVTATARLEKIDGRKLYFHVKACQGEIVIGEGSHIRFVVDIQRFLSKL